MQTQLLLQKEKEEEDKILLEGTVRAIREATLEVSSISSIVNAQGEVIDKIERKISSAESTLKRASRNLTLLIRKSKKRKALSLCLLVLVTACVLTLFILAISK